MTNTQDNAALRFFSESAEHLPGYLNFSGDEHVLDIATGTGNAAIAIAGALPRGPGYGNRLLTEVGVDIKDIGYHLTDAGQWWDIVWNAGLRRYVNSLSRADSENFRKEHLGSEGIWLEVRVLYTSGIK